MAKTWQEVDFWEWAQRGLALFGLLLLAPMFLVLYVAVRLTSRGPFLYRQHRPGQHGAVFCVLKIRTMTVGSDQNLANAFAVTANNPQVTRIGKVLRDLKIDELPQLWNIVRGEMRLIGPRPIAQALHQRLCEEIPGFARRLDVKPGLTNLGQVCIYDNAEGEQLIQDWTRRLEADLHYIRHQSFWYDIVMLVMTALFVARKLVRRVLPAKSTPKPVAQREPISAPAAKAS